MSEDRRNLEAMAGSLAGLRAEIGRVVVGQEGALGFSLLALLGRGHLLLEGVPGIGKTLLAKSLARSLSLSWSRIQFTPDLLPADVLGSSVIAERGGSLDFRFEEGPVFANLVLADEINRASPKTQSALLEAMEEGAVTLRGETRALPSPFLVLATQNPLEMEGTYPLPEAQIDRFLFKVNLGQPEGPELEKILELSLGRPAPAPGALLAEGELVALQEAARDIVVPRVVLETASRLVLATQPERPDSPPAIRRYARWGSGPRGAQALLRGAKARALAGGRPNAALEDLEACLLPALRHRVSLNYEGQSAGFSADALVAEAWKAVAGREPASGLGALG